MAHHLDCVPSLGGFGLVRQLHRRVCDPLKGVVLDTSGLSSVEFGLRYVALIEHGDQHRGAASVRLGDLLLAADVGDFGSPDQARQIRRLGNVEFGGVDAEPHLGRGPDAIGASPEVDRVEVSLKDVLLVRLTFELDRQRCFFELANQGAVRRQERVLHVLLGDGGSALEHSLASHVGPQSTSNRDRVNAWVGKEVPILSCDHGVDQDRRHLVECQRHPVLLTV